MVNENRSSQDRLSLICYQRTCDPLLSSFLWNKFLAMYGKLINFHMSMKVFALMWMRFLFDENENHLMYVIDIWLRFFFKFITFQNNLPKTIEFVSCNNICTTKIMNLVFMIEDCGIFRIHSGSVVVAFVGSPPIRI